MSLRRIRIIFVLTATLFCTANSTSGSSYASRKTLQETQAVTNVLGGRPAPVGRFLYLCSLTYRAAPGTGTCAGMLVAPRWVMTAAHCLSDEDGLRTIEEVSCGMNRPTDTRPRNRFESDEVVVHELFDPPTSRLRYDIALIKLDREAKFDLPLLGTNETEIDTESIFIAGWGEYDESGNLSEDLRLAQVYPVDNSECGEMWNEQYSNLIFDEGRICAGGTQGRICYGDSGGPLIVAHSPRGYYGNGDPEKDMIIGISSFGECGGRFPSVFTHVAYFRDWIEDIIDKSSN